MTALSGGGLDKVVTLMEGESLFNDATSIVLFEIFFDMVKKIGDGSASMDGGILQEGVHILVQIAWLAAGMGCTSSSLHCVFCGLQQAWVAHLLPWIRYVVACYRYALHIFFHVLGTPRLAAGLGCAHLLRRLM